MVQAVAETAAPLAMAQVPISTARRVRQIPVVVAAELTPNQILQAMVDQESSLFVTSQLLLHLTPPCQHLAVLHARVKL